MKKFFIFLFSVFLITFMGCSPATGEIPEIPALEAPEEFEVFALDNNDNILLENGIKVGIEKINAEFKYTEDNFQGYVQPYFYKKIKINNTVYIVRNLVISGTEKIDDKLVTYYSLDGVPSIQIVVYGDYEYCITDHASPLDFQDFIDPQKNMPIRFENKDAVIFFSDLYEEVVQ